MAASAAPGIGVRHHPGIGVRRTGIRASGANGGSGGDWATYSKFDFVPGEKILAVEDFSQDAIGDFPDKMEYKQHRRSPDDRGQKDGKWLSVTKRGIFLPEFITDLPDNFTLQFDLVCNRQL